MHTVCVCLCVCVFYEILWTERCIATPLPPVKRALPGELHKLLDDFLTWTQSGECAICLSSWFDINTLAVRVCVCVSPVRSWEQNIVLPHFFHQRKELCLVSSTNYLMSSLLQHTVANVPFASVGGFNMRHTKPCPSIAIQDTLFLACSLHPFIVTHNMLTQKRGIILPS